MSLGETVGLLLRSSELERCVCLCSAVEQCLVGTPALVADARIELSEQRGSPEVVVPCYASGRFKSSSECRDVVCVCVCETESWTLCVQ